MKKDQSLLIDKSILSEQDACSDYFLKINQSITKLHPDEIVNSDIIDESFKVRKEGLNETTFSVSADVMEVMKP